MTARAVRRPPRQPRDTSGNGDGEPPAGAPPAAGSTRPGAGEARSTAPAGTPAAATGEGPSDVGRWLRTAATFAPPLTVVTALLFYFGWARADEQARQLGIDVAVLGMSTQDYLLISISSLYVPLGVVAVALLGWLYVHRRIAAALAAGRHVRPISGFGRALQFAWLVLPVAGFLFERARPAYADLVLPAGIAAGVLLSAWGVRLRRLTPGARSGPGAGPVGALLVGAVVALALFWELSAFAGVVGRGLAAAVVDGAVWRPGVVVYSPKNLQITAPGVTVTTFDTPGSAYGYRYSGLRLLERSGGNYFLLPDGWSPEHRVVLVVPDDGTLRFEFDSTD